MNRLLILFILSSQLLFGQALNSNIRVSKTSNHVNIPFTQLYIIPPPDFAVSQIFSGLKRNDESHFLVYEGLGENFYSQTPWSTRTSAKTYGEKISREVLTHQELTVNGYPAIYAVSVKGKSKLFMLTFGDSTFATTIQVTNPTPDEQRERQFVESLNSIYYDKNEYIDPFSYAPFVIDEQHSTLKFCKILYRQYLYTVGGKENAMSTRSPRAMVGTFPAEKDMKIEQLAELLIGKEAAFDFVRSQKPDISTGKSEGQDTCEAVVYGKFEGKEAVTYYYIVLKGNQVVTFQAASKIDFEESIKQFKLLAHTIKIK